MNIRMDSGLIEILGTAGIASSTLAVLAWVLKGHRVERKEWSSENRKVTEFLFGELKTVVGENTKAQIESKHISKEILTELRRNKK